MRALCLVTVKPGKVDIVVKILNKKRRAIKEVLIVTGRADICAFLQGSIQDINNMVIDFKKIKEIVNTETLIEVEVDLGW
ncbi:MAG: hypothetical protein NPMRTHETA2_680005 [Nitrosopumilales archaeon]|nr:MAG: hypothetical protein NPMRTHETA2_680005 [Nitrosopumilales archaeon]